MITHVKNEGADKVSEEQHLLGRFGWADPRHDPDQSKDRGTYSEWKKYFPVFGIIIGLPAQTDSTKNGKDAQSRHTTAEWKAEAALFSHLVSCRS